MEGAGRTGCRLEGLTFVMEGQILELVISLSNKIGSMPLESYEIMAKIGAGKYSSVYRVKRLADGGMFALKKVCLERMTRKERQNALNEVKLLSAIKHPHVVALVEVFYDDFIESLCLILELALADLNDTIAQRSDSNSPFAEPEIWDLVEQVSSGLDFLHSNSVLHRDIKTSNILSFNGGFKIADLNVSTLTEGLAHTRTGTLSYASPEIWKGASYNSKSDIWSLGCVVYEAICLRKPFEGESVDQIYKKISKCQYQKIGEEYSRELRDLVSFMIQINPKLRPSAQTILKMSAKNKKQSPRKGSNQGKLASFTPNYNLYLSDLLRDTSSGSHYAADLEKTLNRSVNLGESRQLKPSRQKPLLTPLPSTLKVIKNVKSTFLPLSTKPSLKTPLKKTNRLLNESLESPAEDQAAVRKSSQEENENPPEVTLQKNVFRRLNQLHKYKLRRNKTEA